MSLYTSGNDITSWFARRPIGKSVAALLVSSCVVPVAVAAERDGNRAMGLEEVVVTARKRSEDLQKTPIAMTAFSEQSLKAANLRDISEIGSLTPNLNFSPGQNGGSSALQAFIRGVGEIDYMLTTDPTVGLYIDGVYIARTAGADIGLASVEQVEVLRGPQGTLFGKNTIGGAINVTMKKPSHDAGFSIEAGIGNYGTFDTKAYFNTPIFDMLAANLSVAYRQSDGWQERPTGGDGGEKDRLALRGSLLWTPIDNFESLLSIDTVEQDQASYANVIVSFNPNGFVSSAYTNAGLQPPCCTPNSTTRSGATSPLAKDDISSLGISWTNTLDYKGITFKSITAYRDVEADFGNDYDHSAAEFYSFGDETSQTQFSQEIQIIGNAFDGRLDWVVGLYYFTEDGENTSILVVAPELVRAGQIFDLNLVSTTEQETTSEAAFIHMNYAITEKLSASFGARYTEEEKELDKATLRAVTGLPQFDEFSSTFADVCTDTGPANQGSPFSCKEDWDDFSPKVTLNYQVEEDILLYASASKGFRSGGFNGRATSLDLVTSYEPEEMKGYELGVKSEFLDSRLRVNVALFKNDYTDKQQQVNTTNPTTGDNFFTMNNAGEVDLQGAELEISYLPTVNWMINFNAGYLDAEYKKYFDTVEGDLSHRELPHAPEWTYSFNTQYSIDLSGGGEFIIQADVSYKDDVYLDVENSEALHADDYAIVNASLRYITPSRNWEFALTGKNLTDEEELVSGFDGANFFGIVHGNYTPPTQWMISVKYSML